MSILCLKCNYSITEPICCSCIIKEVKIWSYDKKIKKEINMKINSKLKIMIGQIELLDYASFPSKNLNGISIMGCIKCKEEMPLICSYCIINQISQIIKSHLKNKKDMASFYESFNTNLYNHDPLGEF